MKRIFSLLLVFVMTLGLMACGGDEKEAEATTAAPDGLPALKEGQIYAGYARRDITPEDSLPMGGYGNSSLRMSTGYTDNLYATCIAITDKDGNSALLYGFDLLNTKPVIFEEIRTTLSETHGIPEERIVLSASHTHSAPDIGLADPMVSRYRSTLTQQLLACAEEALADRAPANLLIGSAATKNLNFVRRYVLEGNIVAGYQSDLNDLGLPIIGHESEVDNELQILKFDRAESGKKDIIMANFQAHPHRDSGAGTTLYTANIVGFFRTELEEKQNVHVLYFTGASGNVNASSQIPEENITPTYADQGRALAQYAIDILPSLTPVSGGPVKGTTATFEGKINHSEDHLYSVAREADALWKKTNSIAEVRKQFMAYGIHSPYHASAIITKANLGDTDGFDIWAISFGDVSIAVAPYEMFDTSGMYIKDNTPFKMTFVATCANGGHGYFPSLLACQNGGYEPDTTRYEHGSAEALAELYVKMLNDLNG